MNMSINVRPKDFKVFSQFACLELNESNQSIVKKPLVNVLIGAVIGIVLFSDLVGLNIKVHWPTAAIVVVPFLMGGILYIRGLRSDEEAFIPKDNGLVVGESILELSDSGIKESCKSGYSFYYWDTIEKVVVHEGNVYLFIDKIQAVIIPSSSFHSELELDEFINYVNDMKDQFQR